MEVSSESVSLAGELRRGRPGEEHFLLPRYVRNINAGLVIGARVTECSKSESSRWSHLLRLGLRVFS